MSRGGFREGAGRPKGVKNKYNLRAVLNEMDFDIEGFLIETIEQSKTDLKLRIELVKFIIPYLFIKQENDNVDKSDKKDFEIW